MWGLTPGDGGERMEGEGRRGGQEELRRQHSAETMTARLLCHL